VSFFSSRSAQLIAVASGKGGAGKTNASVNLSVALARGGAKTMLVDCDMGLANAAILLGLPSSWTIGDLLAGRCALADIVQRGPGGLHFVPGHSGTGSGSTLSAAERGRLLAALAPYSASFDHIVIDTGGGIDPTALALVAAADVPLIVLTPEPTSFMDAYAVVKALHVSHGTAAFRILTNFVRHELAGRDMFDRFRAVVTRFIDVDLVHAGSVPNDPYIREAVLRKRCVVDAFPGSPAARAFTALARRMATPVAPPTPAAAAPRALCLAEEDHGTD
jgi:flagellar biosynthesis protein FlhG